MLAAILSARPIKFLCNQSETKPKTNRKQPKPKNRAYPIRVYPTNPKKSTIKPFRNLISFYFAVYFSAPMFFGCLEINSRQDYYNILPHHIFCRIRTGNHTRRHTRLSERESEFRQAFRQTCKRILLRPFREERFLQM